MWLPLRLVLEFLGRSAAWLAVLAALGVMAALLVALAARWPRRDAWPRLVAGGIIGGLLGASLADRFGLPEPFTFEVWRRAVPLAWSAGGALLGGAAAALWQQRTRRHLPPTTPPEEPMDDFATLLEDPATSIAVVGAGDNPAKFGGRIYRDLKAKGFRVMAVNPRRETVDGDPCYRSVADLPEAPTIVDLVVPPPVTLQVLQQCLDRGLRRVWIQPGAEDEAVLAFLAANGFTYRAGDCIMVRARPLPTAG